MATLNISHCMKYRQKLTWRFHEVGNKYFYVCFYCTCVMLNTGLSYQSDELAINPFMAWLFIKWTISWMWHNTYIALSIHAIIVYYLLPFVAIALWCHFIHLFIFNGQLNVLESAHFRNLAL